MLIPKMPRIKDYLKEERELITPTEKSHFGQSVPELVMKYGKKSDQLRRMGLILPYMICSLKNVKKSYRSAAEKTPSPNREVGPEGWNKLREYILSLGCRDVGFTTVPRDYIFSNKEILYPRALILSMEMDHGNIMSTPSQKANREVWKTYKDLGIVVNRVAEYLRDRGFNAQAGPALGGDSNYPLLAQKAGMGQIGLHGLLISCDCGPCQRLAVVYTDIEDIPLTDSDEYSWVKDFCGRCGKCARRCPGKAIFSEPMIQEDGSEIHINSQRCVVPFSKPKGCSTCIKECVFNRGDYQKIKEKYHEKTCPGTSSAGDKS
ncbi:MAG: hypothetical protein PQJ60_03850 [Spirochaetales bacterium]|nr:hypothetical protein [Spirochaetales bacterium]